jgi:archaellum component FlaC
MPLKIETELKEVLEGLNRRFDKIDQKLDRVQNDITELKIGQAEITGKVDGIKIRVDTLEKKVDGLSSDVATVTKELSDLKGVKSLIVPAFVAIFASLLTLLTKSIHLP